VDNRGGWHFPSKLPPLEAAVRHESALEAQIAGLREAAELLRRQLDDVRTDRDAWRDQAQAGQRLCRRQSGRGRGSVASHDRLRRVV
jgi:hypothetical protein